MRMLLLLGALLAAGAAVADEDRPRVLVLEPTSDVVDKPTVNTIASLVIVELTKNTGIDVISANDVKRLAELEGQKQAMGCSDTSCLAELAGAMGARYVVFGDVGRLGSLFILNLNLFDSQKATAVNRATVQAAGVEDLPPKIVGGVHELVAPLFGATAPAQTTTTAPTTTPTTTTTTKAAGPSPLLTWGLIGGGLLVMAGGGVFDLLSPTSDNKQVDAIDFVGPTAMVVGIGSAAAGAILMAVGGGDG